MKLFKMFAVFKFAFLFALMVFGLSVFESLAMAAGVQIQDKRYETRTVTVDAQGRALADVRRSTQSAVFVSSKAIGSEGIGATSANWRTFGFSSNSYTTEADTFHFDVIGGSASFAIFPNGTSVSWSTFTATAADDFHWEPQGKVRNPIVRLTGLATGATFQLWMDGRKQSE